MIKLRNLIGLAGVANNENSSARQWGHRFELLMVIIAIWLPLQWHLQLHHQISHNQAQIANWLVWTVFVTETTLLLFLVRQRLYYLKHNWMNTVIISLGLPFIWQHTPLLGILRGLQLLLMLRLMLPWWNTSVHFLSRNRLGTTLLTAFVTTTLAGVLITILDPKFQSPWEGIWWAWQTVTTVGYGDIVPVSFMGRLLAVVLMLMGLGLFSVLTANFSAYFVRRGNHQVVQREDEILDMLKDIQEKLKKIEENSSPKSSH